MFVMDAINWLVARPVLCLLIFMFIRSMIQSRQPFPEAGGRTKGAHSTAEFDGLVKDGLTLVDFYATWCPPCRACTPAFGAMSMKLAGAEFVKCDVDECREVAQREGVSAMPTFKIYKGGKCAWTCTGFRSSDIEAKLLELGATRATATNKTD
ncbi:unnamed protein product [Pelagomonas calceolata]|uniref:Thioredoxin domain-containing protein n=1 Tax=Pelagomonas calceolata TaxID=35677 RepID=A0A8J2SVH7_9STRA|nr:unnamed protein product [Pelagomonas calceolata]|mmetsp:Transcript_23168/g.69242  ORF Transcript_23168/g.69242 Transcript_23168/m.69242 type:complete len:153 (-) Transcript_23168:33-491(-)